MILPLADLHAPMGSFFPCLVFIGFPIFFIYLLNRSVMGEIGCVTAILMAFTVVYLLGVLWKIEDPIMHYSALAGIGTLFVALPVLEKVTDKISDVAMQSEQIKVCYQQIRMNPQNAMAAFRLGKILYERGDKESGLAVASEALRHLPASAFREEHRLVALWSQKTDISNLANINCAACGHSVYPSALICPRCLGSLHLDRSQLSGVLYNRKTQKVITIWSCLLLIVFLIPMMGQFPPYITIPVILILVGISVWGVVSAFVLSGATK